MLTCWSKASAAKVSARGSRLFPAARNWARVERSSPTRRASAAWVRPPRAIASVSRPRNTSRRSRRSIVPICLRHFVRAVEDMQQKAAFGEHMPLAVDRGCSILDTYECSVRGGLRRHTHCGFGLRYLPFLWTAHLVPSRLALVGRRPAGRIYHRAAWLAPA